MSIQRTVLPVALVQLDLAVVDAVSAAVVVAVVVVVLFDSYYCCCY